MAQFRLFQTLVKVSVLHVIHLDLLALFTPDRSTIYPNDAAGAQKYPFRNLIFPLF